MLSGAKSPHNSVTSLIGEGEIAVVSAKRWDRRNSEALIELATPCHDGQVMGPPWVSNPLRLSVLTAKLEDCTTAPQRLNDA